MSVSEASVTGVHGRVFGGLATRAIEPELATTGATTGQKRTLLTGLLNSAVALAIGVTLLNHQRARREDEPADNMTPRDQGAFPPGRPGSGGPAMKALPSGWPTEKILRGMQNHPLAPSRKTGIYDANGSHHTPRSHISLTG